MPAINEYLKRALSRQRAGTTGAGGFNSNKRKRGPKSPSRSSSHLALPLFQSPSIPTHRQDHQEHHHDLRPFRKSGDRLWGWGLSWRCRANRVSNALVHNTIRIKRAAVHNRISDCGPAWVECHVARIIQPSAVDVFPDFGSCS